MAPLRLIAAVACATAAAAAPTSSRGLPASARRAGRRPAGERALAAHLGRPRLQRRRVGDGHDVGLELRGEDGAQGLKRSLLGNAYFMIVDYSDLHFFSLYNRFHFLVERCALARGISSIIRSLLSCISHLQSIPGKLKKFIEEEGSSIGMKPPLCLDMDRMSGLRERDVSRIGTLLDGIGRCSSLAPRFSPFHDGFCDGDEWILGVPALSWKNGFQRMASLMESWPLKLAETAAGQSTAAAEKAAGSCPHGSQEEECFLFISLLKPYRKKFGLRLRRRRETMRRSDGMEMEMVNLKLYLENRCILEENERLREKASALHRENLALRADLRNTSSPATTAAAASSC
uniref:BZIP domain-containing protein n=1 Tax=Oryza glumipatula TaxID=40148 RepID=A0A0E0B5F7_9ORYZ